MQLGGVALAGDADRGTKTTEGLSLLFTTAGITVQGPQPQIERLLVWSGLDTATCREKIALSDGRSAAVMELTSGGQSIRFLLPTETVTPGQAAYLDQALPAWLARYKGSTGSAPAPAPASSATQTAPGGISPAVGAAAAGAAGAAAGAAEAAEAAAMSTGDAEAGAPATGSNGIAAPPPATGVGAPAPTPYSSAPPPPPPEPAATVAGTLLGSPTASGSSFAAASPEMPPPPPPPSATSPGLSTADPLAATATGGWEGLTSPATGPEGTAWDTPPVGQAGAGDVPPPSKKTRSWRRGSQGSETPPPASGTVTGPQPPSEPPASPVLLTPGTLPQPPAPGPVVWKPPVDPVTGEAVWDSAAPSPDFMAPEAATTKKPRPWRRSSKAAAAAGAAAGAAAIAGGTDATDLIAPAGATEILGTPGLGTPAPPTAPGAWTAAPGEVAGDAAADPFGSAVPPFSPSGGSVPPTTGEPSAKGMRNNRTAMVLLVVLLVVVIVGGGVYYWKNHNNNTTTTPSVTGPVSPSAADIAVAGTINLRLTDLPAGWTRSVATGQLPRPPVAPVAAQVKAGQAMSSCTGQSFTVVSGLFGDTVLPGQSARVLSPTFASGTDPGIQMFSTTTVMASSADAQALAAPFATANFATCFGQYQSALVAAAVPGATAAVQTVALTAPVGVKSYGYLTTFTIPGQGTEVVGEAFIVGGRTETRIEPSTNGPAVPATAFGPAYTNVVGRVSQYSK
jgi:hypothetical protein